MKSKGFGDLAALRGRVPDAAAPVARHAELEAAIERQPEDRATYLVYADALERDGDPRGAWITLHDAAIERPEDGALGEEPRAYLERHELYLLGELATAIRSGTARVTWFMGFVREVTLGPAPAEHIRGLIDLIARLPACRFLRSLTIANRHGLDTAAILAQLTALGRPRTLAHLELADPQWIPTDELCRAFPALDEAVAGFDELVARIRVTRVDGALDWVALPRFTEAQVRMRLARIAQRLATPDPVIGLDVDPAVFIDGGAVVCGGGRVAEVTVPDRGGSVMIEGDLVVDGVLEQPFRSAPVIVLGDLRCRALCTDGYLVVMGDLVVDDMLYGCCTNYATIVFGALRATTVLLDRDHHLAVHGERLVRTELTDEEDGGAAILRYLDGRRLYQAHDDLDASTVAARLRG